MGATAWYQLRAGDVTGWANSTYLARTTAIRDATSQYRQRSGAQPAATPSELVERITRRMNEPPRTEGKYRAEILGVKDRGGSASATIYACCELDDSIKGEQAEVTMTKSEAGWKLERAEVRWLCYRGATADGSLCI